MDTAALVHRSDDTDARGAAVIRRLAAVVLGLAAATALTWWLARVELIVPERPPDPVSVRVRQATIVVRHRGTRQAEIAADRVDVSADRRLTTFEGKTRAVFYEGGAPAVTATGGRIVLDRVTQSVRVDGGLRLTTPGGETLTARNASWNQESRVIELSGDVTAQAVAPPAAGSSTPGMGQLRADHIRYDTRTRVITASGNVVLRVGETEIRADRLRIESGPQVATAEGNVTVRQRESRVAAPTIRYELRTETAEATGGVVLEQQGATVRAPQMRFDMRSEVTVATGGVDVAQGESTLRAPSVRFEGRTGDVTADGGITLVQPGSRVTGRRLVANLPAKRADVRGDVVFVRSPASGPSPGSGPSLGPGSSPSPSDRVAGALAKEETTITAGRIDFRWDVNEAEA
jgi:lipopolysaccharide transport protein LptA